MNPSNMRGLTSSFANVALMTPERKSRAVAQVHGTPRAANVARAAPGAGNPASVDEMYSNMSLLLFLQAATTEVFTYLGSMNWLPARLALKLRAAVLPGGAQTIPQVELMKALVDGYLCHRTGDADFSGPPLAICEAKPFVRDMKTEKIQRQETAEMASWIAQHANSDRDLLQASRSGRKR